MLGLFQLMMADISRVPHVEPYMGLVFYGAAGALFVVAYLTDGRIWVRLAVSWTIGVGLTRSLLYFFDDRRLPPLGFNLSIALLLYLNYMTRTRRAGR